MASQVPDLISIRKLAGEEQDRTELCLDKRTRKLVVRKTFDATRRFTDATFQVPLEDKDVAVYRKLPKHPNLINVISEHMHWPQQGLVTYLLEPYCNSGALGDLLVGFEKQANPLPEDLAWHLIIQIFQALNAARRAGLHHGDLHANNAFLNFPANQNSFPEVVLGDFGPQDVHYLDVALFSDVRSILERFRKLTVKGRERHYSQSFLTWMSHLEFLYGDFMDDDYEVKFTTEIMARFYLQAYRHVDRSAGQQLPQGVVVFFQGVRRNLLAQLARALPPQYRDISIYTKQPSQTPFTDFDEELEEVLRQCEVLFKPQNHEDFVRMFGSTPAQPNDLLVLSSKYAWFSAQAEQMGRGATKKFVKTKKDPRETAQMADIKSLCAGISDQARQLHRAQERQKTLSTLEAANADLQRLDVTLAHWIQNTNRR